MPENNYSEQVKIYLFLFLYFFAKIRHYTAAILKGRSIEIALGR